MLTLPTPAHDPNRTSIARAVEVLRTGGVVAYPTDTFYGLAVDPRNDAGVARLYELKGRDSREAIPLVASSILQAQGAGVFDERAGKLAAAFWPGPLTIVVPARPGIARRILGHRRTIAIRVAAHAVAQALAEAHGFPITSTSANRSGQPPAASARDLENAHLSDVDVLLDSGPSPGGQPSTIVEMATDGPRLVRAGAIAWKRVLESLE